jgi:hypothetical protein
MLWTQNVTELFQHKADEARNRFAWLERRAAVPTLKQATQDSPQCDL